MINTVFIFITMLLLLGAYIQIGQLLEVVARLNALVRDLIKVVGSTIQKKEN
jgi:hypothetical protein